MEILRTIKIILQFLGILALIAIILLILSFTLGKKLYNNPLVLKPVFNHQTTATPPPKPVDTLRILVLNGGGTHGIIQLYQLKALEELTGMRIPQLFDVVVGASSGAIIAVSLTAKNANNQPLLSPEDLINIYNTELPQLMTASLPRKILTLNGFNNSLMSIRNFQATFKKYLGATTFDNALLPTMVPIFCVPGNQIMFFKSWCNNNQCATDTFNSNFYNHDVITSSITIPVLLEPVIISNGMQCGGAVDSAVFINAPAFYSLPIIAKAFPAKKYIVVNFGTNIDNYRPEQSLISARNYTFTFWLQHFLAYHTSIQGSLINAFLQSDFANQDKFTLYRIQPGLTKCVNPVDVSTYCIRYLNEQGRKSVAANANKLQEIANLLKSLSQKPS